MKAGRRLSFAACAALSAALAACVPRVAAPPPVPAPPPRPIVPPAPPPAPLRSPPPVAWQDGPLTAGDWSYEDGAAPQARFGTAGGTLLALRCDPGRQIGILRPGAAAGPIIVATSFGERTLSPPGNGAEAPAALPASDPLFEEIAFSRGRFLVRSAGGDDLVLPSWPEPARLIEDCRGE